MTVDAAAATAACSRRRHCYTFERQSGATCPPACCSQPVLPPPPLYPASYLVALSYIFLTSSSSKLNNFLFQKGAEKQRTMDYIKNISRRQRASTTFRSSYFSFVKCKFGFSFLFVSNFSLEKYVEMVYTKRKANKILKNDIPPIPPSSWPPPPGLQVNARKVSLVFLFF